VAGAGVWANKLPAAQLRTAAAAANLAVFFHERRLVAWVVVLMVGKMKNRRIYLGVDGKRHKVSLVLPFDLGITLGGARFFRKKCGFFQKQ
jgi:hypothetical protein